MTPQHDEVKPAPVAQTWTTLKEARAELEQLWKALFTELAAEAGLPPPKVQPGIASYDERKHADALAKHVRVVLGVEASCFTVRGRGEMATRYCVSLT